MIEHNILIFFLIVLGLMYGVLFIYIMYLHWEIDWLKKYQALNNRKMERFDTHIFSPIVHKNERDYF